MLLGYTDTYAFSVSDKSRKKKVDRYSNFLNNAKKDLKHNQEVYCYYDYQVDDLIAEFGEDNLTIVENKEENYYIVALKENNK